MAIGNDSAGILFKIKADSDQATKEIERFKKELKELEQAEKDQLSPLQNIAAVGGLSAKQFQELTQVATFATAAFAAVATAAIATGAAIAKFTKDAADFGSEIYDASLRTGLGAESLSALKFAAEQSGTAFDKVTKGVSFFSQKIGDAVAGNKDAQDSLGRLKVTTTNLDDAMAQVFKTINNATNATERASLAAEAFGSRLGKELIPVILDANGKYDDLIARAKELGVTLTEEDAKAADEFGDQLSLLGTELAAVANKIGFAFMPVFNKMAETVNDFLIDNQKALTAWKDHTKLIIDGVIGYWEDLRKAMAAYKTEHEKIFGVSPRDLGGPFALSPSQQQPIANRAIDALTTRGKIRQDQTSDLVTDQQSVFKFPTKEEREAAEEAKKAVEKRRQEREAAAKKELADLDANIRLRIQVERDGFDAAQKDFEKNYLERNITEQNYLDKSVENIKAYRSQVMTLIREAYLNDIKQATTDLEKQNAKLTGNRALAALNEQIKRENADIRANVKKQNAEDDKKAREEQEKLNKALEEEARIRQDVLTSAIEAQVEALGKLIDKQDQLHKQAVEAAKVFTEDIANSLPGAPGTDEQGPFDLWTESWENFVDSIANTIGDVRSSIGGVADLMIDSMNSMASAVASSVEQWILYGDSIGEALKKALAAELAHIAGVATVNALFATALGFLRLAQHDYKAAGDAFISAGIWAAVAAAAGIGAKAVAGDSFKKGSGAAAGGSRSPQDLSRNRDERDMTPISRQNDRTFDSGNRGFGPFADLAAAVRDFRNHVTSVKEGVIVAKGAQQNPRAITNTVKQQLGSDPSLGTAFRRKAIGG